MKTAPFNLKAALAGKSIVTRNGKAVTDFQTTKNSTINSTSYPYEGKIKGEPSKDYFTDGGQYSDRETPSEYDLFMLVEEDAPYSDEPLANTRITELNPLTPEQLQSPQNAAPDEKETPRLDMEALFESIEKAKASLKKSVENIDFCNVTERIKELRELYVVAEPGLKDLVKQQLIELLK